MNKKNMMTAHQKEKQSHKLYEIKGKLESNTSNERECAGYIAFKITMIWYAIHCKVSFHFFPNNK